MVVYTIYTLLDWPGMRTSIVTCFFVALGSLGETVHKLTLRISGALIGGSIAALCIVFVLPHMTDIGQLCVLIAVVSAGAGWIATSSERLSYAGLQIAFAFFLGILQDYAPATDLTVLRDRVAGILLGNVVMTLIFSLLWPESATSRLRAALAEALRAIGGVIKGGGDPTGARIRTAQALVTADHFEALSSFELSMLPKNSRATTPAPELAEINRLAGAALVATAGPLLPLQDSTSLGALARWADAAAESTANAGALPQAPPAPATTSSAPLPSDPLAGIAQRATEDLRIEIGNVVTTTL
jgi:multidrug resistance protein MdtO